MNTRRAALIIAVLVGAAGLWWLSGRYTRSFDAGPKEPAGERVSLKFFRNPAAVPTITLHDLDGRTISSADWRGKVTIVNFWATWCPPCRAEIPDLVALQNKYGDRLQIIGVSQDEGSVEAVRRFVIDQRMNYPVVMMTPELEKIFTGIRALPTSFIVDREVRVVQRHVGMLNPMLTEQETRALAGLPVNASIEEIDRNQPAKLENAAQATEIPGVDLASLSPERRTAALQKLNTEPCTCGCENTIAKCRIDDPKCGTSLPIAQRIVQEIVQQP
jgi:cytochrome c biogenesis protein CcmG/thiol:disulfide interchange protein DsbE